MNIFVLDIDVIKCARYHNNRHCVKMILETTQLLNNALIKNNAQYAQQPIYKQTHQNHPASIWCSSSLSNFQWLTDLGLALCEEYTYRYNKIHKCQNIIKKFNISQEKLSISDNGLTPFAKCMPDQYKVDDAVQSYRNYYISEKIHLAKWKNRSIPFWWPNKESKVK